MCQRHKKMNRKENNCEKYMEYGIIAVRMHTNWTWNNEKETRARAEKTDAVNLLDARVSMPLYLVIFMANRHCRRHHCCQCYHLVSSYIGQHQPSVSIEQNHFIRSVYKICGHTIIALHATILVNITSLTHSITHIMWNIRFFRLFRVY